MFSVASGYYKDARQSNPGLHGYSGSTLLIEYLSSLLSNCSNAWFCIMPNPLLDHLYSASISRDSMYFLALDSLLWFSNTSQWEVPRAHHQSMKFIGLFTILH